MAVFDTPLIDQLLTSPYYTSEPRPSNTTYYDDYQWTYASTSYSLPPMPKESKSAIQAQFPPGSAPLGTMTAPSDPTTNLLETTPPQIVRALAQAEPLIRGLNFILSLVTWTSGNDWLSFFLVVAWWVLCLFGSFLIKFAGNFLPAIAILAYYTVQKSMDTSVERTSTHSSLSQTLKEIDTLRTRINLFLTPPSYLGPYIALPASQPFLLRLAAAWPIWLLITHKILPPAKVMLALGTSVICWSAPWARVICVALWRSRTVRKVCSFVVGQDLLADIKTTPPTTSTTTTTTAEARPAPTRTDVDQARLSTEQTGHQPRSSTGSIRDVLGDLGGGIKVTQTLYQSQRRWLGMGWTTNLFPNERAAWADETENPAASIEEFQLPPDKSISHTLPTGEKALRVAKWKWIDPEWKPVINNQTDSEGWVYTDNTWKNPSAFEAFGKFTRRRKLTRVSELTEEIIPVHEESRSPRLSTASPAIGTPSVGSPRLSSASPAVGTSSVGSPRPSNATPTINQQPSTSRMNTPGPSTGSPPPREAFSPPPVRSDGSEADRQSLAADIRDAVGLELSEEARTETSGESGFGDNS